MDLSSPPLWKLLNSPLSTRMRCFLGRESVRADNALALARPKLVALTNSAKRSLPTAT